MTAELNYCHWDKILEMAWDDAYSDFSLLWHKNPNRKMWHFANQGVCK